MCEWGINHIATRPELISSFISCVRQSDWHTSCSETSALALQKERKRKQKRKNNAYKKKLQIFLWKLDFLFWSLYDSHFEVVWVFKLSVGSIFFGLWLFSLVLCCFFFSPSSLSLLFLSFFLPSRFWWVFTSISGETEAACWGARTEMERTASLAATHSSVTPIPRLRGHTPLWNTDGKSEGRGRKMDEERNAALS